MISTPGEKPFVPDHKIMLIPFEDEEEAHYVCAVANSSPFRMAVSAYAIDLQQGPHILENIRIVKYEVSNAVHRRLTQLSRRAHEVVGEGELGDLATIEAEVDGQTAQVWGLSDQELKEIQAALPDD